MASKCCNADLIPVVISSPPGKTDIAVAFTSNGITRIEQYCGKCGGLNKLPSTPDWVDEFCKEAIR